MRSHLCLDLFLLLVTTVILVGFVEGAPLPNYDNIFVHVANDDGAKYNTYGNDTYHIRFEGYDRGLNVLHISNDPAVPAGQVTTTTNRSGTFFTTDTGGKAYDDNILLLVAVNGTLPETFRLRITADGYTWTPNPEINKPPVTYEYQPVALDEVFTRDDFVYGPQTWKPTANGFSYPLFEGQNTTDAENTFRLLFIDLNAGVLGSNATLNNRGALRINYSFEHLPSFAAFNVYGYCKNPNQGEGVAWTNKLGASGASGFSVASPPVLQVPGGVGVPRDLNGDGRYDDVNGNGRKDFADVTLYFNQMTWIGTNEPIEAFDYNDNGRIDFADVAWLFNHL
jgi:PKD repeat protein